MPGQFSVANQSQTQGGTGHFSPADWQQDDNTQPPPPPGFWNAMGSDLWNAAQGLGHTVAGVVATQANIPEDAQENMGITPLRQMVGAKAEEIPQQWEKEKAAGYSLPYRVAAVPAGFVANVPGMEQSAAAGDANGVLGHAAAGATLAVAPYAAKGLTAGAD